MKQKQEQIASLKQAMEALHSQRATLGDAVVEAALESMKRQLAELEGQVEAPEQRRKLVTILFTDIVGSTRIAREMDPEDVIDVLDAALKRLAEPVDEHGGHVTRFQGDGFKAVFGLPTARENDPEQAIRAGLALQEVAGEIATEMERVRGISAFKVRVGINTGLVAAGGWTEAEDTIMGRTVNLAVRLESAAPPGSILISHDTYRHVRGVFDVAPQEPIDVKGFDNPVPIYLVIRAKHRTFRVHSRDVAGVETRMVGREAEMKFLQDAIHLAESQGEGHMATVLGEAGIGKSRLIYEFHNWLELLPHKVYLFQGFAHQENQELPYTLLRDMFARRFNIQEDDPGSLAKEKFESRYLEIFPNKEEALVDAHFLGQLLGFDFSHSGHLRGLLPDAQVLRNRGLRALEKYFRKRTEHDLTVIILEDIHWADESSLDAFQQLGKHTPDIPLLIVCLARPGLYQRRPYWGEGQAYHTRLDLRPLSKLESQALVEEILRKMDRIPPVLRALVVRGAEGNPFYIEELVKMLVEQGVITTREGGERWQVTPEKLSLVDVPATLTGVLQARLDSLPPGELIVLQQASVVGRVFWDQVVKYIYSKEGSKEEKDIVQELAALRDKEMVFRREESAFAGAREYIFKHDVLREVTYETVLRKIRLIYHGIVADWLIENGREREMEYAGLIADHLERGGRADEAVGYLIKAGEAALSGYANAEAERYFRRAFDSGQDKREKAYVTYGLGEALHRLGRDQDAISIWRQGIQYYQSMSELEGMARLYEVIARTLALDDPEGALQVCREGLAAVEGLGEVPALARLLSQTARVHLFAGYPQEVQAFARQALAMGESLGDAEVQAETLATLGLGLYDVDEVKSALERAVALAEEHYLLATAVRAHTNLAIMMIRFLGDLESYNKHCFRALEIARQRGVVKEEMLALRNLFDMPFNQGDFDQAEDYLEQVERLANQVERLAKEIDSAPAELEKVEVDRWAISARKGDWQAAYRYYQENFIHAQIGNYDHYFVIMIRDIVPVAVEMDKFGFSVNWTEIESRMVELVEITEKGFMDWIVYTKCMLSVIYSRQHRMGAAGRLIAEARQDAHSAITFLEKAYIAWAEAELGFAKSLWEDAINSYKSLVELYSRAGFHWNAARARFDLAESLAARSKPGDREEAITNYQLALQAFQGMKAHGYVKTLQARLESMD